MTAGALTNEVRAALLLRALRLEARSLAHYLARSAPPVDAATRPAALRALESIAREEDDAVRDLAQRVGEVGGSVGAVGSYDPRFTALNYVGSAHALGAVARRVEEALAALDAIAAEAGDDLWVAPAIAAARERRLRHRSLLEEARRALGSGPRAAE